MVDANKLNQWFRQQRMGDPPVRGFNGRLTTHNFENPHCNNVEGNHRLWALKKQFN
jgi:hypothetical protein